MLENFIRTKTYSFFNEN